MTRSTKNRAAVASRRLVLFLTVFAAAPRTASAQLPPAERILARYIDALGGEATLRKHSFRYHKSTISMPAQGMTMTLEAYAAPPDLYVSRMDMAGMGTVRSGYDGKVAWTIHPATGPMLLEGAAFEQQRQQVNFYEPLDRDRYVKAMETLERTDFQGRSCYKVKVVANWGEEYFEYYDAETGLLAGIERKMETPMGPLPTTTIIEEYRDIGGMKLATKMRILAMGMEQIVTVDSASVEKFDMSVFELPAEIKALLK